MSPSEGPTAILVVDDEEAILSALSKFLTVKGYDVSTAASGEEALDAMRRLKIAGLVLDVRMPGLSGIDLVPKVLQIGRRTTRTIKGNIIFTLVYNFFGLSLAALGYLPPILAAAAQSIPDLAILVNSSRLLRQK